MYENVQDDTLQQISFNLQYLFNACERTHHTPPSLLHPTNKKFVYRSFAFYVQVNM